MQVRAPAVRADERRRNEEFSSTVMLRDDAFTDPSVSREARPAVRTTSCGEMGHGLKKKQSMYQLKRHGSPVLQK